MKKVAAPLRIFRVDKTPYSDRDKTIKFADVISHDNFGNDRFRGTRLRGSNFPFFPLIFAVVLNKTLALP